MKALNTEKGQLGPFIAIETLDDRYRCDGVDYPYNAIGAAEIGEWIEPDYDDAGLYQALVAKNIQVLWQAAHDYEYQYINGMAIGLLVLGMIQSKPKAIAVQQWSKTIWDLYYARKSVVTDVFDDTFQDFSSIGAMPYSVPELISELGL
ncbi:MAG: hypothetical protein ACXWFA_18200 [Methylobacter sp.]